MSEDNNSNNKKKQQTCLIIGGGYGGLSAAVGLRKLNSDVQITLIEPKDYFEVFWATYRTPFDQDCANKSLKSLSEFCTAHNVQHIKTIVSKLSTTTSTATLGNGEVIPYDVCLIAVGAGCRWKACGRGLDPPATRGSRLTELRDAGTSLINDAKSVVIIGGGLIGSEVAGEIAYHKGIVHKNNNNSKDGNSSINVTLIQSGSQLCAEMNTKAALLVQKKLEKLGVRVVLNERAAVHDDDDDNTGEELESSTNNKKKKVVKLTKSGEKIKADEVIMTIGNTPMATTIFGDETADDDAKKFLNEEGLLMVEDTFAVKGSNNKLFAVGDCCDLLPNQGAQVLGQISVLGTNLNAALLLQSSLGHNGSSNDEVSSSGAAAAATTMKPYIDLGMELYNCTVGPKDGVTHTSFCGTTTWLFPYLKNKTMFFFKVNSDLGFKN